MSSQLHLHPSYVAMVAGLLGLGSLQALASGPAFPHPPAKIGGAPGRGKMLPPPPGVIAGTRTGPSRTLAPGVGLLVKSSHGSLKQGHALPGPSANPANVSSVISKSTGQASATLSAPPQGGPVAPPTASPAPGGNASSPNTNTQGQAQPSSMVPAPAALPNSNAKSTTPTSSGGSGS